MKMFRLLSLSALTIASLQTACTDDEKKVEESVTAQAEAAPAEVAAAAPSIDLSTEAVLFAFDDSTLSAEGQAIANKAAEALKANSAMKVNIEGHTDSRGSTEYNLALGERRANAVKAYLLNLGIDASRISTISLGEERPAMEGDGEAVWSKNRRAVVLGQ